MVMNLGLPHYLGTKNRDPADVVLGTISATSAEKYYFTNIDSSR